MRGKCCGYATRNLTKTAKENTRNDQFKYLINLKQGRRNEKHMRGPHEENGAPDLR